MKQIENFLGEDHALIFLRLGLDGVQPYGKLSTYSLTPLMTKIYNLPQAVRSQNDNLFLTGIIPGPKKPPTPDIYIELFLKEITQSWQCTCT